jgi:hypothetical protein
MEYMIQNISLDEIVLIVNSPEEWGTSWGMKNGAPLGV